VRAEKRRALQRTIYEAALWATLPPGRDEYEGPIRISKPLTLQGASGVVSARCGPLASLGSPVVALRNLLIEITGLDGGGESNDADVR